MIIRHEHLSPQLSPTQLVCSARPDEIARRWPGFEPGCAAYLPLSYLLDDQPLLGLYHINIWMSSDD